MADNDIWAEALAELKSEQTSNPPPAGEPATYLSQFLDPLKRTAEEAGEGIRKMVAPTYAPGIISKGLGKVGLPGLPGPIEAMLEQGSGALQLMGAPVTGLLAEPVSNIVSHYGQKAGVPEPYAKAVGQTSGLLASMMAPNALTNWPSTIGRGLTRMAKKPLAKLAEKEALTNTIAREESQRIAKATELGGDVDLFEDAARGLTPQANIAERAKGALSAKAQAEVENLKALQSKGVDPSSQQALSKLRGLPLKTEPTPTTATEIGKAYVGDRSAKQVGLFEQNANTIKKQLSARVNAIIPEGLKVEDITPLREAAKSVLPEVKVSDLSTRAESIASGILRRTTKLDPESRAQELERELEKTLSGEFRGKGLNLKDLINPDDLIIGQNELPTARALQHERSLLRAMERAANKSGQSSLAREIGTLENGYTDALHTALGTKGASELKAWDSDYAYAVNNLFGYKAQPYKLAQKKAEDVVSALFRNTGELQATRVLSTAELLGPENKPLLANGLLTATFNRSQAPGVEFNPVKWGREYLKYKDDVRNAVFSPDHKKTLDEIAKTFSEGPVRHASSVAAMKKSVDVSKARAGAAAERSDVLERSLLDLKKEAAGTQSEINSLIKKPTDNEIVALERLAELEPKSKLAEFLKKEQPYAARRGMFGIGSIVISPQFGAHLALESGLTFLGAGALHKLLTDDRGAKIIRAMTKSRAGSTEALRYGNMANLLLKELDKEE